MRAQHDAAESIAIRARILWERDGLEVIDTFTLGWTSRAVRVQPRDPRWQISTVWVPTGETERR